MEKRFKKLLITRCPRRQQKLGEKVEFVTRKLMKEEDKVLVSDDLHHLQIRSLLIHSNVHIHRKVHAECSDINAST